MCQEPYAPCADTCCPLVMATVHPSSLLRAPDDETRHLETKRFVADLKKIAKALGKGLAEFRRVTGEVNKELEGARSMIEQEAREHEAQRRRAEKARLQAAAEKVAAESAAAILG